MNTKDLLFEFSNKNIFKVYLESKLISVMKRRCRHYLLPDCFNKTLTKLKL